MMQGGCAIFDDAVLGMACLDADLRIVEANKALAAMLGRDLDDLTGLPLLALLSGMDEPPPFDVATGTEFRLDPPASARWVRLTISGDGEQSLALLENMTETKMFDAQLRHAERLALLGDLVSALSHEVGQPLNVVRLTAEGALDRMEAGGLDPDRHARSLNTVIDQAGRLQDILDHILVWARPPEEAGLVFAPGPALEHAVQRTRERQRNGSPVLKCHIPTSLPDLFGHPERFEQAVFNLVVNACAAAPKGRVDVSCGIDAGTDEMVVAVQDDGVGLPPSVLERLTLGTGGAGHRGSRLGLGLTVALGIVSEMGGCVSAANTGPGARVEIRLPVQAG